MRLLIAGGGTGGHVFPALAVADELRARDPEAALLFIGTERGFEARAVPAAGYRLETVDISGLKRVGTGARLRGLLRLPTSYVASWRSISRFRPDVVLGVGGYASGPVLAAAWSRGIPTAICEQNSIPGFTNRHLGKVARAIFISFECSAEFFPAARLHLTGNPVRRELLESRPVERPSGRFRILVLGGSQGARPLNERLPAGFARAVQQGLRLEIVHQTGEAARASVAEAYRGLGLVAEVRPFIANMGEAYARADLVVARAGATTCAEITALGIPAVLIPFPQAADDHQTINAQALFNGGGALLLPQQSLDAKALASALVSLCRDDGVALARMAEASRNMGRPGAAAAVIESLTEMARGVEP